MPEYAILLNPGHSRVYYESALALSACELEAAAVRMDAPFSEIKIRDIGGVSYICFSSAERLNTADVKAVSRLSFTYAIFELINDRGGECLIPVQKCFDGFADPGISAMLKYQGKTNELFTRMMINLAFFACKTSSDRFRLLDPVSGKGTTLLEGLAMGFDVAGAEILDKPVHELEVFLKKYLENAKYKHTYKKERISGKNPAFRAAVHSFEIARTKEEFKTRQGTKSFVAISGDSRFSDKYWKKNAFDIIIGDLPYGIAHGNVSGGTGKGSPTRNPGELLSECLPAWRAVLKPGGAMALSWNAFVLPKREMTGIIKQKGFQILEGGFYDKLEHRVDQAIKRDVVVALKI